MKLNNVWGYGQLFGYSAIEGPNRYYNDFIGTLTKKKICIRFELKSWVKVSFDIKGKIKFNAVMSDFIDADTKLGKFFITFADNDTLVGYSPVPPQLIGQNKLQHTVTWGTDVFHNESDAFGLKVKEENGLFMFCIHHSFAVAEARSGANYYINADIAALRQKRFDYYKNMPKCRDKRYEMLYYKALSINKVNVRSAEGKIPCRWTTPDRVPHRHMWLWDSVFHALAIATYNQELAKDAIRAVLSQQREDGFISHMMNPTDCSDITQPQVLSWGVWEIYKKTGDLSFLRESVNALDKFLTWTRDNRDKNGNGLLEWFTEPDDKNCRCGESGLDNSPRFDFDEDLDAVDFSAFLANDAGFLAKIYAELGDIENHDRWLEISSHTKEKINALMWDNEDGVYYDRTFSGKLSKMLTPMSFLPLFAEIPTKEQAERMVKVMTDENLLWTPFPLASISRQDKNYSNDMWRGGVWLNLNYFIIKGLTKYGFNELADTLRERTLEVVNKWFKKTGSIYEFYDPEDKTFPYLCERKGKCPNLPDWRKHVHSISDYNWSACFTILFIQRELY
jgi:hypothetical protein